MQIHTTLQPATYCELALAVTKMQATSRQEECCEQNASNMAAKTVQMHMRFVVVKESCRAVRMHHQQLIESVSMYILGYHTVIHY